MRTALHIYASLAAGSTLQSAARELAELFPYDTLIWVEQPSPEGRTIARVLVDKPVAKAVAGLTEVQARIVTWALCADTYPEEFR